MISMGLLRFYLLSLKGAGYLNLRLGRVNEGLEILQKLSEVDPHDRLHVKFLLDMAQEKANITNNESCVMGIRPENISICNPGEGNIDVEINVVENIGSEYLAYIFLKNGKHIVVKSANKPSLKDASLIFQPDKILFFDA